MEYEKFWLNYCTPNSGACLFPIMVKDRREAWEAMRLNPKHVLFAVVVVPDGVSMKIVGRQHTNLFEFQYPFRLSTLAGDSPLFIYQFIKADKTFVQMFLTDVNAPTVQYEFQTTVDKGVKSKCMFFIQLHVSF